MFHIQSITDSLEMKWQETKTALYRRPSLSLHSLHLSSDSLSSVSHQTQAHTVLPSILIHIQSTHSQPFITHSGKCHRHN